MRIVVATVAALMLTLSPPLLAQSSKSVREGAADRTLFEDWLKDTGGDFHDGAFYWEARRDDARKPDCRGTSPPHSEQWMQGCEEAQQRLARFDPRRRIDPGYRQGWNSVSVAPSAPQPPPDVMSPVLPRRRGPVVAIPRSTPP